jgi:hypothetical protein
MSQFPWTPERELSTDEAAELIRSQAPDLRFTNIAFLGELTVVHRIFQFLPALCVY